MTMEEHIEPSRDLSAWLRLLAALPSRLVLHALALLALVALPTELPPVLAAVATSAGAEALVGLLQRLAYGENISAEEIRQQVQEALQEQRIAETIQENQRLFAGLFRRLDILDFVIQNNEELAQRLLSEFTDYQELVSELYSSTALSIFPRPTRASQYDIPLIGRDDILGWLENSEQDALLIGQPGSGKTFLLFHFAQNAEGCLFVVGDDRVSILHAIRTHRPSRLIIDDAHTESGLTLLENILQLRQEADIQFSIIATSWPVNRATDRIRSRLRLGERDIRQLERLDRDEMVGVVNAAGIVGPNSLVREIVDQAAGLPGLAIFLSNLSTRQDYERLVLGETLTRILLADLESLVGADTSTLLAAFAVGGDAGLDVSHVARVLEKPRNKVVNSITRLAAGGVVHVVQGRFDIVAVRPRPLQYSLIRDVFFGEPLSPLVLDDYRRLLEGAVSIPAAVLSLVGAARVDANVPFNFLAQSVSAIAQTEVWNEFAALGEQHVGWVLDNYPDRLTDIAYPALLYLPERVAPLLLERAVGDERRLNSTPEHPLRILQDWIQSARRAEDAIARRRMLIEVVKTWLQEGQDTSVGLSALRYAFSPITEFSELDPGRGHTVTLHSGYLTLPLQEEIRGQWPGVRDALQEVHVINWSPLRELVEDWAFPRRLGRDVEQDVNDHMRAFAEELLRDLVSTADDHPGVSHWAYRLSHRFGLAIEPTLDPVFETLYPPERFRSDWRENREQWLEAVRALADEWADAKPSEIVGTVLEVEQAARELNISYPRMTPDLYTALADRVASSVTWLRAGVEADLTSEYLYPFLSVAILRNEEGWEELARGFLHVPNQKWATISLVLQLPAPPADLLEETLNNLDGTAQGLEILALRQQLDESIMQRLLTHEDDNIATAVAWGEWHGNPKGEVREGLLDTWREVIMHRENSDNTAHEFYLTEIFKTDPEIARGWLEARLTSGEIDYFHYEKAFKAAANSLDVDVRQELLYLVPEGYEAAGVMEDLVNNDLDLYREVLTSEDLRPFRLTLLQGHPTDSWVEKARMALNVGYSAREVAMAAYLARGWRIWTRSGDESAMWQRWIDEFKQLLTNTDERIRRVGQLGQDYARERQAAALERERHEAIFGR